MHALTTCGIVFSSVHYSSPNLKPNIQSIFALLWPLSSTSLASLDTVPIELKPQ